MSKVKRITWIIIIGNIFIYYDFLLLVHLSPVLVSCFFPNATPTQSHIITLFLFGSSFLVRPIGGIIFGYMADVYGRKTALINTVKWAILPALLISILPGYTEIGSLATVLFVLLRLAQGLSLGGEFTNAGTYLMEYHRGNYGFISGLLTASGALGSLFGVLLSIVCIKYQYEMPWLWRTSFLLSAGIAFWGFNMRAVLDEIPIQHNEQELFVPYMFLRRILVTLMGMLVGLIIWIPMIYTHFFVVRIEGARDVIGLHCTLIALCCYAVLTPLCGIIYDRIKNTYVFMMLSALCVIPFNIAGLILLQNNHCYSAQILLIISAAFFSAPMHSVMNKLFPPSIRARNVSFFYTLGLCVGGIAPGGIAYLVDHISSRINLIPTATGYIFHQTNYHLIPIISITVLTVLTVTVMFLYKKAQSN